VLLLLIGASRPAGAAAGSVEALSWLAGCWKNDAAEPGSGEQWMAPAGGTMLGMSRTVRQGRTAEHEFMRVGPLEDGTLAFIAHPSGQATAIFPVLSLGETEVIFENLQHDFPQRVAYRLASQVSLVARIEGMSDGALRVIEFPMSRVSCEE
jgi:hypothetical protein